MQSPNGFHALDSAKQWHVVLIARMRKVDSGFSQKKTGLKYEDRSRFMILGRLDPKIIVI